MFSGSIKQNTGQNWINSPVHKMFENIWDYFDWIMDTEKEVQNGLIIKSILEISLDKYFRLRKDSINVKAKNAASDRFYLPLPHPATYKKRSSHQRCSVKNGALKNFSGFTGKHLCSLFLIKLEAWRPAILLNRDSNTGVFLWILWIFKIIYSEEHVKTTASEKILHNIELKASRFWTFHFTSK